MKLYELPNLYRRIDDLLDESGGEVTAEVEALLNDADATLEQKVDACAAIVRERMAQATADASEAAFFARRAQVAENAAARLKSYLMQTLEACGLDRATGKRFSVRVQPNSTPSVRWEGDGDPPDGFVKTTVALDGLAAIRAYREGTLPDGFVVTTGQHLRIR